MNNKEFIYHLTKLHPGMYFHDARKIVKIVFDAIRNALMEGSSIYIPRVGTIYPTYLGNREGRQWTTPNGIETVLKDKVRLKIKPSRQLTWLLTEKFKNSEVILKSKEYGEEDE